jgi:UDP-2,3-diacylglucosamine hydrolase
MELRASSRWRNVDLISDLHLHLSDGPTYLAWVNYLKNTTADAIFILGDLFEVWVGDDCLNQGGTFENQCVQAMQAASCRLDLYIMHGNRDFLMGPALMKACSATLIPDPTVLVFSSQRWLLTHGDDLCLDDLEYMRFRAQVRSSSWKDDFLQKPLRDRMELARNMRNQSETIKRSGASYADVDTDAAHSLLQTYQADHMIHGHTHRPANHTLREKHQRLVLTDWDLLAKPPRAGILRLSRTQTLDANNEIRIPGVQRLRLPETATLT